MFICRNGAGIVSWQEPLSHQQIWSTPQNKEVNDCRPPHHTQIEMWLDGGEIEMLNVYPLVQVLGTFGAFAKQIFYLRISKTASKKRWSPVGTMTVMMTEICSSHARSHRKKMVSTLAVMYTMTFAFKEECTLYNVRIRILILVLQYCYTFQCSMHYYFDR